MKRKIHKKLDFNANDNECFSTNEAINNSKKNNAILIIEFIGILFLYILFWIFYQKSDIEEFSPFLARYGIVPILVFFLIYHIYLKLVYSRCRNETVKFFTLIIFAAIILIFNFGFIMSSINWVGLSSEENGGELLFLISAVVILLNTIDLNLKKSLPIVRIIGTLVSIILTILLIIQLGIAL